MCIEKMSALCTYMVECYLIVSSVTYSVQTNEPYQSLGAIIETVTIIKGIGYYLLGGEADRGWE